MSHDIRTPMNAILGMSEIARRHLDNPDKLDDCLTKIQVSGDHLLRLINQVLDMSKIESGQHMPQRKRFFAQHHAGERAGKYPPGYSAKQSTVYDAYLFDA